MKYRLSVNLTSSVLQILGNVFHNQVHGAESLLRNQQAFSYLRNSQHFMEPECSLLCLQEPATGPCPEPDESSPYNPVLFL
jgi:hypothetical protein